MHIAKLAWITGAGGFIGSNLVLAAPKYLPGWTLRGITRSALDLTAFAAVREQFGHDKPDLIIHCAALNQPAFCGENPALAKLVNVGITKCLAELAVEIPLMFFSTDLVFDGRKGNYVESDPVNPLSVYAETKVTAEQIVLGNPRHTVIRSSLTYGTSPSGNRSFNEQMKLAWETGRTLRLFTDEYRNPIPAPVTARVVWELVQQNRAGVYHLGGAERLSRWEIGQAIFTRMRPGKGGIEPASLRDYKGEPRPPDTSMNCAKIQALLSFRIPGFREWLRSAAQSGAGR